MFTCAVCGKQYKRESALANHMRSHKGNQNNRPEEDKMNIILQSIQAIANRLNELEERMEQSARAAEKNIEDVQEMVSSRIAERRKSIMEDEMVEIEGIDEDVEIHVYGMRYLIPAHAAVSVPKAIANMYNDVIKIKKEQKNFEEQWTFPNTNRRDVPDWRTLRTN